MEAMDWTLIVLAAAGGKPLSPVQLQKALFLIGQEVDERDLGRGYYRFSPYDYGPFCSEVYADAESLEAEGLAVITRTIPRSYREYSATLAGLTRAEELRKALKPQVQKYVDKLVAWILPLSFDQLVRAIYRKYPGMKANSIFEE